MKQYKIISLKTITFLSIFLFVVAFSLNLSVFAQTESPGGIISVLEIDDEDERCDAIKHNIDFRKSFYSNNVAIILSNYKHLQSDLDRASEIYDEIGLSTIQLKRDINKFEQYLDTIDILEDDLIELFENADEVACTGDRDFSRYINDAGRKLEEIKSEIREMNSFLTLQLSRTIRAMN
jgi:hypothetical protein